MTLTFESEDKILWSDHSIETSLPVLSRYYLFLHGAIFFTINFILCVRFCIWPHLAVKGLNLVYFW